MITRGNIQHKKFDASVAFVAEPFEPGSIVEVIDPLLALQSLVMQRLTAVFELVCFCAVVQRSQTSIMQLGGDAAPERRQGV